MSDPSTPDPRQTLAAAARLHDTMADLRDEIGALRTYGRHNRRYIWGLIVSLLLDLILSIVVAFFAVQATEASSLANQNRQTQRATCEAGNQARAVSRQLWNYVLDLSSKTPENQAPERKQRIEQFRQYMESAYAQRDCAADGK